MKKTKIIASLGPTSCDKIEDMILEGVDVFRINTSYVSMDDCKKLIDLIRKYEKENDKIIGIMLDTDGPCIRLDKFMEGEVNFIPDREVRFYDYHVVCNNTQVSTNFNDLTSLIKLNDVISIDDGEVSLQVIDVKEDNFLCKVLTGGVVKDNQTIHVEDINYKLPFLSSKDKEYILFGIKENVDFLALSNVRDERDILEVVDLLIENSNDHMSLIAKIENEMAFDNLDEILKVSDGVIVSRGDLGCNIPLEKLPYYQKKILESARTNQDIGLVATDLLKTMVDNLNPSRAEVADVYNAILDKCDGLVLCDETSIGADPVNCINILNKVILSAEEDFNYKESLDETFKNVDKDITSTIAYSVVDADLLLDANAIIANTLSGYTAKKISYFHPKSYILGLSPDINTLRSLTLNYGVLPIKTKQFKDTDTIVLDSIKKYKDININCKNDIVIITGGLPIGSKNTNFMKIEKIGE